MNNRQLAQIGLGLLGVWALLSAVGEFFQIAAVGASLGRLALAEVIPVSLMLGVSYLLIFHNAQVATVIFPDLEAAVDHPSPDVAKTLVALTGVLLLVQAAPSALNTVLILLSGAGTDLGARGQLLRRLVGSLVPMASGIYLITRPGRLLENLDRPVPELIPEGE